MCHYRIYTFLLFVTLLTSCGTLHETPRYQFTDDEYQYRQKKDAYQVVYVDNQLEEEDTVLIYPARKAFSPVFPTISPGVDQYFLRRSFHLNLLTIPFKFRPSVEGFPSQLNSSFNGALFFGYRLDKFRLHYKSTPAGMKSELLHWGLSGGVFGGFGSTPVTPWTTSNRTMDEYNGFVLSRGVAVMGSINRLTVGLGVGTDYLTDRDKDIWIHQNKAWYGLTIGINLN
ncbi:MAG TPA: hypothetical protein PKJ63_02245 [Cyclobacteriaceae bacterium]|nr:hypothetical protein [Cyclobacteriaceae bacterium]